VEVAARGPISNTMTIVDRATEMAAPQNMEAETQQAPGNAPTPQEDEIGQGEWRSPPQWSGYWSLQRTQRANDHMWRGGDRRSVRTMPYRPGRDWRTGWRYLNSSNQ